MARTFGRNHGHVDVLWRLHSSVVDGEAVREHQHHPGSQVRLDSLAVELLLAHVRRQHHHDVRLAHGVRDCGYVQTGLFRLGPGA